jgi:hypothetical protein
MFRNIYSELSKSECERKCRNGFVKYQLTTYFLSVPSAVVRFSLHAAYRSSSAEDHSD